MACVGALQWLQSSDDLPHEQCTWNDAAFSPHVVGSQIFFHSGLSMPTGDFSIGRCIRSIFQSRQHTVCSL